MTAGWTCPSCGESCIDRCDRCGIVPPEPIEWPSVEMICTHADHPLLRERARCGICGAIITAWDRAQWRLPKTEQGVSI